MGQIHNEAFSSFPHSHSREWGLQQGFAIDEMGFRAKLHSSNREARMSALGQKQTLWKVRLMSALPPKADIAENDWHVRFVPKADIASLFDKVRRPFRGERES